VWSAGPASITRIRITTISTTFSLSLRTSSGELGLAFSTITGWVTSGHSPSRSALEANQDLILCLIYTYTGRPGRDNGRRSTAHWYKSK
jgi:hypothetical protein